MSIAGTAPRIAIPRDSIYHTGIYQSVNLWQVPSVMVSLEMC